MNLQGTASAERVEWLWHYASHVNGIGAWCGDPPDLDAFRRARFSEEVQLPGEIERVERLIRQQWNRLHGRAERPTWADHPMGFWTEPHSGGN